MLICWSTGPTVPILSKNKKIMLQNFGQLAFLHSTFWEKIRNKTYQTYVYNQNQEGFIFIISYKLRIFSSVFAMQNTVFKKYLP